VCRLDHEVEPEPSPTPTSPPSPDTSTLSGTLHLCNRSITVSSETITVRKKVDVVYVIDVSGSMRSGWSGYSSRPKKITSAKNVLKTFTDNLQSGDRAALVSFGKRS